MTMLYLKCVREGSRLRVKILSPGYLNDANCQFPRSMRREGQLYMVDESCVRLVSRGFSTYFYSVRHPINAIVNDDRIQNSAPLTPDVVYASDGIECVICFDNDKCQIIVPCGHYCTCINCVSRLQYCPLCRTRITGSIHSSQLANA